MLVDQQVDRNYKGNKCPKPKRACLPKVLGK